MYSKINNGTTINIQGLECNIPPEGYVYNQLTGLLEKRDIIERIGEEDEQFWERKIQPQWYKDVIKREDAYLKTKKDDSLPFYDERYEEYKRDQWDKRLNGMWFYNYNPRTKEVEPVYLPGQYWLLLQHWPIDIGYAKFTIPHLDAFRFQQYCIEDPICMGMIEITKRRFLKTYKGGLFVTEYPTRTKNAIGGIQSKTGNDAKKVFSKAVIFPFKRLPRFFRPEYDMSLGFTPKTEIRFQQTNVRGKKAEDNLDKDELGSMIDWGSADVVHFDGHKLHRYFCDEFAKTVEANVFDRHEVIRYCLLDEEGKIIGKALYSSTVEKLESDKDGVQKAAKQLWDASDQNNRKKNGMTESGLYRFFQTADESKNIDKYGYPDVEKTINEILEDRESVKDSPRALSARKKKEPRTIGEAFSTEADSCLFNADKLEDRKSLLELHGRDLIETGNFIWKDGVRDSNVIWCPDAKGKWQVVKEFLHDFMKVRKRLIDGIKEEEYCYANMTEKRGMFFLPHNDWRFGGATDPYDHDTVEDNRRSMAASLIKQKYDPDDSEGKFKWCDICKYIARPSTAELMYEDILIQHFFFSCKMLPETQKPGIMRYFRNRGYANFLMILPGYSEPGIPSTPENKQMGCEFTEYDVETKIDKYYFADVIEDLLMLNIKKTQPFDLGMAKLWTEIACMNKLYERRPETKVVDITKLFKQYKIRTG